MLRPVHAQGEGVMGQVQALPRFGGVLSEIERGKGMFKPCFGYHAIMLCKDSTCVRCPDLYECCSSSNNRKLAEYQRELERCAKSPNDSKALKRGVKLSGGYLYRAMQKLGE